MKVGTLIRALSLLLVLPSATVLSLTGGIDRTMKAGLALFLLGSMKTVIAADKTTVDGCGPMFCYAPKSCVEGGNKQVLGPFRRGDALPSNCPVIMKTRPYSAKMYRVVLESRDPSVTEITLTRDGGPLFSCKVGENPQYKGKPMDPIGSSTEPLKCEFIAEETEDPVIFSDTSKEFLLIANGGNSINSKGKDSLVYVGEDELYCDPGSAKYDGTNPGDNSVIEAIIGVTDLSCPKPYQMETKLTSDPTAGVFHKTTSIICEEDPNDINTNKNKFKLEREGGPEWIPRDGQFSYRCVLKICTQCDYPTKANKTELDIVDGAEGCKELKCTKNRLKVGATLGDKAICKNNNGKAMWNLEGTWIEGSTTVVCFEKKPCDIKICGKTGGNCIIGENLVPVCSNGNQKLIYQSKQIENIYCDGDTGKWKYLLKPNDGSLPATELPAGEFQFLSCSDSGASGKTDPAGANVALYAGIGAVVAIVATVAIVAAIFIVMKKKRAARNGKTGKSVETPMSKSVNSKESKKEEPDSVLPPEYSCAESPSLKTGKTPTLKFVRPDCSEGRRREADAKKQMDEDMFAAMRRIAEGKGCQEQNDLGEFRRPRDDATSAIDFIPKEMRGIEVFKEKGPAAADAAPAAPTAAAAPAAKETKK